MKIVLVIIIGIAISALLQRFAGNYSDRDEK